MGKIFLHNPRNETEKRACENCHGPGSNHVGAGGGKGVGGLITFRKDSGESVRVQNQACLACHQRGVQTYWEASPHAGRGMGCVDCHTVMEKTTDRYQLAKVGDRTPFFNKRAQTEVCGQCHLQRKAQLMRSSHMPLREGKLTCTDCHNPHGTPYPAQLIQSTINENCYTCHAERRGPFLWEHPRCWRIAPLVMSRTGRLTIACSELLIPGSALNVTPRHNIRPRPGALPRGFSLIVVAPTVIAKSMDRITRPGAVLCDREVRR
jgi:DmsE family decaheme c-type cytochrome